MNQILQVESGPRRLLTTVRALLWPLLLTWLLLPAPVCHAGTAYYIPADLTAAPFNCVMATATIYDCSGSMYLDKDIDLYLTSDVTLRISGNLTSAKNLTTVNNGHTLQATVSGNVDMQKDTRVTMDIVATGYVQFAKNAKINGDLQAGSYMKFAKDTTVNGDLVVKGSLTGAKNVVINGSCTVTGTKSSVTCTGGTTALHHLRVTHTGATTTCGQAAVTVTACLSADSGNSCTAYTGGISGTLVAEAMDGTDLSTLSFNIPSGSSTYSASMPAITSEQTASFTFDDVSKVTATSGTCWNGSTDDCDLVVSSCGVHHVRLDHGGAGVTCVPASVTVNACSGADSGGSCTASTSGISGNVVARSSGGSVLATVPFSIGAGSSSATVNVPVTTAQTATFDTTSLSSTPTGSPATTCWTGSSTSCDYVFADSGFVFDIPNHVAGKTQTVDFKAVKKSNNSNACQPTLPDGDYAVDFSCNYSDPSTGTGNMTISYGTATQPLTGQTLACGTGAASKLTLKFTNGTSSLNASYPDAGEVKLSATYTGANTGTVKGNDFFIAAPAKFVISTTTSPLKADVAFDAKVTAVNFQDSTMPNFGNSSSGHRATLAFSKCGGANTGVFSGGLSTSGVVNMPAFSSGSSTASNLKYSEVGTLDATATMTSSGYVTPSTYMNTGLTVTGTTNTAASPACSGAFGTFVPSYLVTALDPATTKFAYSGVPFKITVTAKNGSGNTTQNYTGTYAKEITLSAVTVNGGAVANTVGTLSGTILASTSIKSGVGAASPTFTFPAVTGGVNGTKLAPQTIYIRAVESSGTATSASPPGFPPLYETSAQIRFGRLRLFNAYGTSLTSVKMPVQAEYWNGTVWVVNGDDWVTTIPAAAIGFPTGSVTVAGPTSDLTLTAGKGSIALTNSSAAKGWTYVTAKLGASSAHNDSCRGTASGVTAANLAGLRSYDSCSAGGYDYDPAARASFGIQSQETKGIVHVREVFN